MGLGWDDVHDVAPRAIYVSISGFGNTIPSPYDRWPAYAAIAEAMSGIYELKRVGDQPPVVNPMGGLGDISSAMFATIGILAALRHRDATGQGQRIDVAMLDAMVAMTDIVTNFWSMGVRPDPDKPLAVICEGFKTDDGYVVVQIGREHQFANLADLVGKPEWKDDPRFATRDGWMPHLESDIRPAVEAWLVGRTKLDAAQLFTEAGIVAGPSNSAADVIADPHVAARHMLVEVPRTDGVADPILVPGNPVKMSKVAEGPEHRMPWVGEHTSGVLEDELGLDDSELTKLRDAGIIT
jgi:crotonobetainyl-CoA:carnitine CoA-transferase CaiB-like acyl-CoA transferase